MQVSSFLFVSILLPALLGAEISQSILPTIERVERFEFDEGKVSPLMWAAMKKAKEALPKKLRVVSYNMLYPTYEQQHPELHHWSNRKERLVELLEWMKADLICPQELLQEQVEYLVDKIGEEYAFYGYRASDGISFEARAEADPTLPSFELNGFFYKKDRLELLAKRVWWLSETPECPSSSPFGSHHRTLTMGVFRDLTTQREFYAFNCHLSFGSAQGREFEALLIAKILRTFQSEAVLLTGDFNLFPLRLDLDGLPFFDGDHILRLLKQGGLEDSRDQSILGHVGPIATYTNLSADDPRPFCGTGVPGVWLDHIFVRKSLKVLIHAVEPALSNGCFPSDHMPLIVDIGLLSLTE
jgi:endonuclease/exonuclease/phosphatase family metal-dependent hydrolase